MLCFFMAEKLSFFPYIYRSSRKTLFVRIKANPKMIRLESKDLPSAIREIKKRKIFKLDKSTVKKKKLQILNSAYCAAVRLKSAIDFFRDSPIGKFKMVNDSGAKDIRIENNQIIYSTRSVMNKTEIMLNSKLRELVR